MPILEQFDPPAFQDDFGPGEDDLRRKFRAAWHDRVFSYFETSAFGSPWNTRNDSPRSRFFNPATTETNKPVQQSDFVAWTAFPKRLQRPGQSDADRWRQGDLGPDDPNHGPAGPRGWQDEYCEWSVERNANNKITRVTFTAENFEYWETLWSVSREKVLSLYRRHVSNQVQLEDLFARDDQGRPIPDDNGNPTYEPANRWNSGTSGRQALHLISAPNNLFAEVFLAGAASIVRQKSGRIVEDQDELIDCGSFGEPGRNSDPTIGSEVNIAVRTQNAHIAIANPVGLYLGNLNTDDFTLPATAPSGVSAADFWHIERGDATHTLRASYFVPPQMGFTVGDIRIDGRPIEFGGQIVDKLQVRLRAIFFAADGPIAPNACTTGRSPRLLQPVRVIPERLPTTLVNTPVVVICDPTSPRVARARFSDPGITVAVQNVRIQVVGGQRLQVVDLRLNRNARAGFASLALAGATGQFAAARPCAVKFEAAQGPLFAMNEEALRERMVRDRHVPLMLKEIA